MMRPRGDVGGTLSKMLDGSSLALFANSWLQR